MFVLSLSIITPPSDESVAGSSDIVLAALPLKVTDYVSNVSPVPTDKA
ncbi:MAG: hypothetical protein ACI4OP_03720 [Candidatus Coprovivens sp.]